MSHSAYPSAPPPAAQNPVPQTGWGLFCSLVKGRWQPGTSWQKGTYRRKFILRSLLTPIKTARLLGNLARQPALKDMLTAQPGLPCRLHRPYLTRNFNRKQTLEAICFHYKKMSETVPEHMFLNHFSEQGFRLATLQGKNDEHYYIDISAYDMQGKEGEVALNFSDDRAILAKLTFTLCQYNQKKTLLIGGLQGAKPWVPHQAIQQATKGCHGLFPKRVLLDTLCAFAAHLDVEQLIAVSNQNHIFRSWRYNRKKKDLMHADYDNFWTSQGSTRESDGLFKLPAQIERKPLEEVVSKKRAEYRRRYQLLDTLRHNIDAHFAPQH